MSKRFGGSEVGNTHFKKPKKKVINRFLYGTMMVENITIAELSEAVGVTRYAVREWIYNGRLPKADTLQKVCNKLNAPHYIIFNEIDIEERRKERVFKIKSMLKN